MARHGVGNFVVQINRAFGHRFIGINYLGDWGRQFALLLLGWRALDGPELLGSEDDQQVSEQVSRLACSTCSPCTPGRHRTASRSGRIRLRRLESASPQAMRLWRLAKRHSLAELDACYRRLSVSFDRLEFESDYAKQTGKLLALLDRRGLLAAAPDGAKLLRLADSADDEAVVAEADGSSLYFGRDLLAALDRAADNLGCGRAHYVVESAQRLHFDPSGRALTALGRPDLPNRHPGRCTSNSAEHEHQAERLRRSGTAPQHTRRWPSQDARTNRKRRQIDESTVSDASSIADRLAASVVAMEMICDPPPAASTGGHSASAGAMGGRHSRRHAVAGSNASQGPASGSGGGVGVGSGNGSALADYEVVEVIGRGSSGGEKSPPLKRRRQLCLERDRLGDMCDVRKQMLLTEINLIIQLRHCNIVRCYNYIIDREAKRAYIIMEYCPNGDLAALIKQHRRDKLALALRCCHCRQGVKAVLHRDLKPANCFPRCRIKLADFGLARVLAGDASFASTYLGTPYYMRSGAGVKLCGYTEKSDMWALGVVAYATGLFKASI
uniref:non-specific serine/threonine protein kinase n=1 Tax=Macrostomum lignano TaxID=282301 RepID=A0A1I8FKD1_9PLAT